MRYFLYILIAVGLSSCFYYDELEIKNVSDKCVYIRFENSDTLTKPISELGYKHPRYKISIDSSKKFIKKGTVNAWEIFVAGKSKDSTLHVFIFDSLKLCTYSSEQIKSSNAYTLKRYKYNVLKSNDWVIEIQ